MSAPSTQTSGPVFISVAAVESLPPGQGRTVEVRGRRFAVYNVEGNFRAVDDACPHRGASLGAGILDDGKIYCPLHGWAFDPANGACLSNPERPVRAYPTRVENGEVQIGI